MIVDVSKSTLVLSNQNIIKLLKSKEASNVVDVKSWPTILDTDDVPKKKIIPSYRAPTAELLAYLDFRYAILIEYHNVNGSNNRYFFKLVQCFYYWNVGRYKNVSCRRHIIMQVYEIGV